MRHLTKRLLGSFGYRMHRFGPGIRVRTISDHALPQAIEFVGPAGVGKSTTFQKFLSRDRSWQSRPLILSSRIELPPPPIYIYHTLLEYKLSNVTNTTLSILGKYRALHYFHKVWLTDQVISTMPERYSFLLEEGLFHKSPSKILRVQS